MRLKFKFKNLIKIKKKKLFNYLKKCFTSILPSKMYFSTNFFGNLCTTWFSKNFSLSRFSSEETRKSKKSWSKEFERYFFSAELKREKRLLLNCFPDFGKIRENTVFLLFWQLLMKHATELIIEWLVEPFFYFLFFIFILFFNFIYFLSYFFF